MHKDDILKQVEEIVKLPEPEFLWRAADDTNSKFYGYKTSMDYDNKRKVCYGGWFMPGHGNYHNDLDKVKHESKVDLARVLMFGCDKQGREIKKDIILFPKLEMTDEQFEKIRKIGRSRISL